MGKERVQVFGSWNLPVAQKPGTGEILNYPYGSMGTTLQQESAGYHLKVCAYGKVAGSGAIVAQQVTAAGKLVLTS